MRLAEIMGGDGWRRPQVFSCLSSCPSVWTAREVSYGSSKNLKMQIRFTHTHTHTASRCECVCPPLCFLSAVMNEWLFCLTDVYLHHFSCPLFACVQIWQTFGRIFNQLCSLEVIRAGSSLFTLQSNSFVRGSDSQAETAAGWCFLR